MLGSRASHPITARVVVLAVAVALVVGACGNNSTPTPSAAASVAPSASAAASESFEGVPIHLAQPGCLTVGTYQQPQISVTAADGTSTGVFGLIWTEAAKRLGLKQCSSLYAFSALVPALQAGRIDLVGAGFSLTQARGQIFYFAPPQLFSPEFVAIKKSNASAFSTYEEAVAKKLTLGTVAGYFEVGIWQQMGLAFKTYDSAEACMQDVLGGGVVGCAGVGLTLPYDLSLDPTGPYSALTNITINGPLLSSDLNGWAFNKNNPGLALALSQQMTDMWRDGTVVKAWAANYPQNFYQGFTQMPNGYAIYIQGPWEDGATPPAPDIYPKPSTITAGTLTVGIPANSSLAAIAGGTLTGPDGTVLNYVASKLGLTVTPMVVSDPAAAVRNGQVDVIAGGVPATLDAAHQYWQSTPTAFSPDYMYVKLKSDGSYPAYTSWEEASKDGPLAILTGSPRKAQLQQAGIKFTEYPDAASALKAVADGSAAAFVGLTTDALPAISADTTLQAANFTFLRNVDTYTAGVTYSWGVKAGNNVLLDALNQGIASAYQTHALQDAYAAAFPGANTSAMTAPGPAEVGTGFGQTKDYLFRGMWVPGPWAQTPGFVQ